MGYFGTARAHLPYAPFAFVSPFAGRIGAAGNAIAVWPQNDGRRYNIVANRYVPGVGWGIAELIETDDGNANRSRIGMDNSGNAIVTFTQYDGTRYNLWANRYTAR